MLRQLGPETTKLRIGSWHGPLPHGLRRLQAPRALRPGPARPHNPPYEKGDTTAGFLARAVLAFAAVGITIQQALTHNGGNYRPFAFQAAASELGIGPRYTRPYRPRPMARPRPSTRRCNVSGPTAARTEVTRNGWPPSSPSLMTTIRSTPHCHRQPPAGLPRP